MFESPVLNININKILNEIVKMNERMNIGGEENNIVRTLTPSFFFAFIVVCLTLFCVLCFCFVCLVVSILKEEFWRDYCNSKKNLECLLILCCCLIPLLLLLYYLKYCIALFWSCLYSSQYIRLSTVVILYAAIYTNMRFLNRNFRVIRH